jgi:alcohol dehydrogenase class IV
MPYVLKFNQAEIEARIILLSNYLELSDRSFNGFLNWILDLRKDLSIPHTLKELKIEFDFDTLAEMALVDPSTPTNPTNMTVNDMKKLYIDSYEGNLN